MPRRGACLNLVVFPVVDDCQHALGRVLFFLLDTFPADHLLQRRSANVHFLPQGRLNVHAQSQRVGEQARQPGPGSVFCSGDAETISYGLGLNPV